MPASDSATLPTGFELDRKRHALRFERQLGATPETAFRAWTEPAQVACWWDATGERLAECAIDLRVGGAFRFTNAQHRDRPFIGTYVEIAPPERLVFEAMGATGTVTLTPAGNGTHMIVEIRCASAEHLEQFVAMGVAAGTSQTLDNLAALLAGE